MAETVPYGAKNETAYRRYVAFLIGAMVAMGLGLGGLALWMGPPSGDLVRIGGWSERSFGWQGPKRGFAEDHYQQTTMEALLLGEAEGDILVFGDSFSTKLNGGISWINTLHEETGQGVTFLRLSSFTDVIRFLDSDTFEFEPPAAIVIQTVERSAIGRAHAIYDKDLPCKALPRLRSLDAAQQRKDALRRQEYYRRTTFNEFDEVFSWGALVIRRWLEGKSKAIRIQLDRDNLFSNRAADQGLIYADDIRLHRLNALPGNNTDGAVEGALCGLRQMIARAEPVPVRVAIAPDKRSVYAEWITTPLPEKFVDVFSLAREALGANFIDLLQPLNEAANSEQDVYYPNDTHWGPIGHRIAGQSIAESLRKSPGDP